MDSHQKATCHFSLSLIRKATTKSPKSNEEGLHEPVGKTNPRKKLIPRLNNTSTLHALPSRLKHSRDTSVLEIATRAYHIRDTSGRLEDERHAASVEAADKVLLLRAWDAADVRSGVCDFGDDFKGVDEGPVISKEGLRKCTS